MIRASIAIVLGFSLAVGVAAADPKPPAKLTVTAIEPAQGDSEGGTYTRIIGTSFIANGARHATVYFGTHQGTVVRFVSDTVLVVEAPGGKVGDVVDVLITFEPGGEIKLPKAFTYVKK